MVRDRELAEDLAQETFIKVLNAIDHYRPEYKFSSWIFKIANNAAIDQLRRRELDTLSLDGSPHAESSEAIEATTLQIGDGQETQLEEVTSRELGAQIERAIAKLRPEYRELHHPAACRRQALRRDRRDSRPSARHGQDVHPSRRNELRILLAESRDP